MASGPRRINFVTLLLLVAAASGGYWMWKFFPHYYRSWQVDNALADAAAHVYQLAQLAEPNRSQAVAELREQTRAKVVSLGVDDPEMGLRIEIVDKNAIATCDWTVVVRHALVDKQSVLRFHKTASADLKRVDW